LTIFISGIAGFIGSKLARHFIGLGHHVVGFDDLSRGTQSNIQNLMTHERFSFETVNLADRAAFESAFRRTNAELGITAVWHMAANSDIPAGIADANRDLNDTFLTTFNLLELMKECAIPFLAFASSSAVYGDLGNQPIHENIGPLLPISNYGAMKLASEAAISAAAESWLERALLFRFPNVIGVPATHGVILDFIHKLQATPEKLTVLGSGNQQKAYLHVDDLIEAMLTIEAKATDKLAYFNIGPQDDGVTVRYIAEQTVERVAPGAHIEYGNEDRGWVGDVPRFSYDISKILSLGWTPRLSSADAVRQAIREIAAQERGS
jgi:UDP-glucose 4-epimerase